ncbi:hypothetical protein PHMEG_00012425, partial [Phytophthora megakarya]
PNGSCFAASLMNSLLIAVRVKLSGVTKTVFVLQFLSARSRTSRELINLMNGGVQLPTRACAHPAPHSGSSRKRTDSSRTITDSNRRHNKKPSILSVEYLSLLRGSMQIGSDPTGGSWRK